MVKKTVLRLLALSVVGGLIVAHIPRNVESSLLNQAPKSIVYITDPTGQSGGTGFAIKGKSGISYILTNDHVCGVESDGGVIVKREDGRPTYSKIVARSEDSDMCLIRGLSDLEPMELADFVSSEEPLYVVGHPNLMPLVLSSGRYISTQYIDVMTDVEPEKCHGPKYFKMEIETLFGPLQACIAHIYAITSSIQIYPGNSGSPVMNSSGDVVGIIFAGNRNTNYGSYVPGFKIREFLERF